MVLYQGYGYITVHCSGAGPGRIRIILPDPDGNPGHADLDPVNPDRY
jgi:hypothetical protein